MGSQQPHRPSVQQWGEPRGAGGLPVGSGTQDDPIDAVAEGGLGCGLCRGRGLLGSCWSHLPVGPQVGGPEALGHSSPNCAPPVAVPGASGPRPVWPGREQGQAVLGRADPAHQAVLPGERSAQPAEAGGEGERPPCPCPCPPAPIALPCPPAPGCPPRCCGSQPTRLSVVRPSLWR